MSWISGELILNKNTKKDIDIARGIITDRIRHNADLQEFPNMRSRMEIKRLKENYIFPSEAAAREYLSSVNWNRRYNPMVAFKSGNIKVPKSVENLKIRAEKEAEKWLQYREAHSVKNYKAKYIGCERCGSKVNKEYIKYELCPVCNTDLRSKTTLETLKKYMDNKDKLLKEYNKAKLTAEAKGPVKYLLMYEEYIG